MWLSCLRYLFAICGGIRVIMSPTKLWINNALLVHVTEGWAQMSWVRHQASLFARSFEGVLCCFVEDGDRHGFCTFKISNLPLGGICCKGNAGSWPGLPFLKYAGTWKIISNGQFWLHLRSYAAIRGVCPLPSWGEESSSFFKKWAQTYILTPLCTFHTTVAIFYI